MLPSFDPWELWTYHHTNSIVGNATSEKPKKKKKHKMNLRVKKKFHKLSGTLYLRLTKRKCRLQVSEFFIYSQWLMQIQTLHSSQNKTWLPVPAFALSYKDQWKVRVFWSISFHSIRLFPNQSSLSYHIQSFSPVLDDLNDDDDGRKTDLYDYDCMGRLG